MVGWQLDNEFGCHDTVRSYDHNAKKRFRSWLQDKYGSIENMNERQGRVFWSSQYASFDTVEPPFLEIYTNNQAHTLDWYTFSSDMVIDFAKEQVEILRMYAPTHAITTNFMVLFTDFDHHKFNREVRMDLATFDEYPLAGTTAIPLSDQEMQDYMRTGVPDLQALQHALYRGISGEAFGTNHGPFGVMEMQPGVLNWNPYRVSPLEGMVRLWTHETFAASGDMVGYFRWRQVPYAQEQTLSGLFLSDNSEDQGYIESQTFAHNDLPKLRNSLQSTTTTTTRQADVALIFDYTAHWIWNIEPYSGSWSVKEASYTNPTLTYTTLVHTFYSSLRRLGLSIDIISPEQDVSGYKILVIPSLPIIPESLSNALAKLSSSSDDDDSPPPTVILGPHTGSRTADFAYVPGLGIDKLESILPGLRVTRIETPPPPTTATMGKGAGSSVRYKNVEYAIGGWEEWIVCDDNSSSSSDGNDDDDAVIITVESTSRHRLRKDKSAAAIAAACSFPFPSPKSTTTTTTNRIHYISFNPPLDFLIEYIRDLLPPSSPSTSPNSDDINQGRKNLDLGPAIRILRRENLLWMMNYGWEEKEVVVGLDEGEEEMLEGMLRGLLDEGEEIGEMIIGGGDDEDGSDGKGNGTITIPAAGVLVWKIV